MVFAPASWTLASIIDEFRNIAGVPDTTMLSDQQCTDLINYYYQFVLPKELKIFWGYTNYQFFCKPNIDQYLAPQGFQTVNPSAYADGFPIEWYLDPDTFYQDWPQKEHKLLITTGDGITNAFPFNIYGYPVLPRSVYVTDGTQVVQDNGTGGFNQVSPIVPASPISVPGTIDYLTGVVSGLAFVLPPAANTKIVVTFINYQPKRPLAILFFKQALLFDSTVATLNAANMFVLRPVPDQVYLIKMQGIQIPPSLINMSDVPFRPDLGPLIALGAALHRFKRLNQFDQYQQVMPEYLRFKDVCMQDTYEELLYERSISKF